MRNKITNSNNNVDEKEDLEKNEKSDSLDQITAYKIAKRLQIVDIISALVISVVCVAIAFGISKIFHNKSLFEEMTMLFSLLALGFWFLVGYLKNRENAQMYNNHRRRYDWAVNEDNGDKKRLRKKIIIIFLILLISTIIIYFVN